MCVTATVVSLISNAPDQQAVVTACMYLFRSLGASIGVSTTSAVLQQVLRTELLARLDGDSARRIEEAVRHNLSVIKTLDPDIRIIVRNVYQIASAASLTPMAGFAAMAVVCACFFREVKLGK